jgi:hypothetical protein
VTHDELLRRITIVGDTSIEEALRAVVELHKPMNAYAHLCEGCYEEESGHSDYPCPTIQAIEKELNG